MINYDSTRAQLSILNSNIDHELGDLNSLLLDLNEAMDFY